MNDTLPLYGVEIDSGVAMHETAVFDGAGPIGRLASVFDYVTGAGYSLIDFADDIDEDRVMVFDFGGF